MTETRGARPSYEQACGGLDRPLGAASGPAFDRSQPSYFGASPIDGAQVRYPADICSTSWPRKATGQAPSVLLLATLGYPIAEPLWLDPHGWTASVPTYRRRPEAPELVSRLPVPLDELEGAGASGPVTATVAEEITPPQASSADAEPERTLA